MFLVVSGSDVHLSFEHTLFLCARSGAQVKIVRPKNRASRKKFVQACSNNISKKNVIKRIKSLISYNRSTIIETSLEH